MKCPIETPEQSDILLDYAAGKLDAHASTQLEEHLKVCAACHAFAGGQNAVWNAMDAWEAPPVSLDFDRRLYARIDSQVTLWDRILGSFRQIAIPRGLPIAAAAGIVVFAGILLQRPPEPSLPASSQSAQVEVAPDQADHTLQEMELMREFNKLVHPEGNDSTL